MKMQLPPIGGVRKVLKTSTQQGSGTTIAEVGSGTVTLAQLAALIQNILNNNNNVVGNGPPPPATLVVGPGLSGGGVLTGNVPLNLTAPISPYSLEDGGEPDEAILPVEFNPTQSRWLSGDWTFLPVSKNALTISLNSSTPQPVSDTALYIVGQDADSTRFVGDAFSGQAQFTFRRAQGSYLSSSAVTSGATIGGLYWRGAIGTGAYGSGGAAILGIPRQAYLATRNGMALLFQVTSNNSNSMGTVWTIEQDGGLWSSGTPGQSEGPGTINANGLFISGVPVQIAPSPVFIPEDTSYDDFLVPGPAGPQGPQGVQGSQGPAGTGSGTATLYYPYSLEDGGVDNDTGFLVPGPTGPQGPQGVQGSQGAAGTGSSSSALQIWVPEDPYWEDAIYYIPNRLGYLNVDGPFQANQGAGVLGSLTMGTAGGTQATILFPGATPQIIANHAGAVLQISATTQIALGIGATTQILLVQGAPNVLTATAQVAIGPATATQTGLVVEAGNSNSVYNTVWFNSAGTTQFGTMYGDGSFTLGTTVASGGPAPMGVGTINVKTGYYINGNPLLPPGSVNPIGQHIIPEDPDRNDDGFCVPPPSVVGPLTLYGPLNATYAIIGNASIFSSSAAGKQNTALGINQVGQTPWQIYQPASNNSLRIGTTATDIMILSSGANGSLIVSSAIKSGTISATAAIPAVTVAQTDIGITTTATVITTAGGISLPALASTFWVVNVNGVAYGIPCFAL
jgi:hypothetical protein